jgi:hypothetical protein
MRLFVLQAHIQSEIMPIARKKTAIKSKSLPKKCPLWAVRQNKAAVSLWVL